MFVSNCAVCGKEKSMFIKIKRVVEIHWKLIKYYSTSVCSNCIYDLLIDLNEQFTKHREMIQKLKETGNLQQVYENKLDKNCFAHDEAHSDGKDLSKRTFR